VVGYAHGPDGWETAYVWTKAGGMRDLGERGGSSALAINQNGDIVGYARSQATMWTSNGNVVDLGRIGVIATSYARAINSVRQVVGQSGSNSMDHAFLWTEGQGMQDLGTFGGLRKVQQWESTTAAKSSGLPISVAALPMHSFGPKVRGCWI
jgi:probable HAF family extracellular repeat protein